jgi:hypothetical protein
MPRRIGCFAILGLVLLVVVAVALVFTARPRLEDDRDRVDERWTALRNPLAQRYDQLAAVLDQLEQAGGGDRDVAKELTRALDRWNDLRSGDDVDAGAEAEASNRLEGLATRLDRTVNGSARLSTVQPLLDALALFTQTVPPADAITAYNDAAERYQRTRESARYAFVARLLGYDARPALVLGR